MVSVLEILAAAEIRQVSLAGEIAGYLVLGVADCLVMAPRLSSPEAIFLGPEGTVEVYPGSSLSPEAAESELRSLLRRLLAASRPVTPALIRASERVSSGGPSVLIRELEAALIPVNRAAGRRALGRLYRETARAVQSGLISVAAGASPVGAGGLNPLPTGTVAAVPSSAVVPSVAAAPLPAAVPVALSAPVLQSCRMPDPNLTGVARGPIAAPQPWLASDEATEPSGLGYTAALVVSERNASLNFTVPLPPVQPVCTPLLPPVVEVIPELTVPLHFTPQVPSPSVLEPKAFPSEPLEMNGAEPNIPRIDATQPILLTRIQRKQPPHLGHDGVGTPSLGTAKDVAGRPESGPQRPGEFSCLSKSIVLTDPGVEPVTLDPGDVIELSEPMPARRSAKSKISAERISALVSLVSTLLADDDASPVSKPAAQSPLPMRGPVRQKDAKASSRPAQARAPEVTPPAESGLPSAAIPAVVVRPQKEWGPRDWAPPVFTPPRSEVAHLLGGFQVEEVVPTNELCRQLGYLAGLDATPPPLPVHLAPRTPRVAEEAADDHEKPHK